MSAQTPVATPVPPAQPAQATKAGLHPRNRYVAGYDLAVLTAMVPDLARFVITTPAGTPSIDFANPVAVKALNGALLAADYGIQAWSIPKDYLCPPIPGRGDMLHYLADLLGEGQPDGAPTGESIRVLDIGVGANGVYPLVGHGDYGWRFVGVDVDEVALANLKRILQANPELKQTIELRHQPVPDNIFVGVLRSGEKFDLTLCNPPFHASPSEAREAAQRKLKNLGLAGGKGGAPRLNFGGQNNELWYPGGERAFLTRMAEQSATIAKRCLWFSSLVSKAENLRYLEAALKKLHPADIRIIPMAQGQKVSRVVAWTFVGKAERSKWQQARWR